MDTFVTIPDPMNEPVRGYAPGSPHAEALEHALVQVSREIIDIPALVGGVEVRSDIVHEITMPHRHNHVIARAHYSTAVTTSLAIDSARNAADAWRETPYAERAAVLLKAADLLVSDRWRYRMLATTMHSMSKTAYEAEIDVIAELADFLRFNAYFGQQILQEQPISPKGMLNAMQYRPLEGFVYAVTPFNFMAIAANLPLAPILMGNVVLWKPADETLLPAWLMMQLLKEAGLPDGVLNFLPGDGITQSEIALTHPGFAGLHFTGSTDVFVHLQGQIAANREIYGEYPRIVGETGGKDFVLVHESADRDTTVAALIRGGFGYQGQKCSAASRVYVPKSMWPTLRDALVDQMREIHVGSVGNPANYMGAVINRGAFEKITGYIDFARAEETIVQGGTYDDSRGYFVKPTLVQVSDSRSRLMTEEIFGPVVSVFVYDEADWVTLPREIDQATPYALTGSVIAQDRSAIAAIRDGAPYAAGNFYINREPSGAVVGQQPFGGSRRSGTNDKAGSMWNLIRWVSPRTISESLVPNTNWRPVFLAK